MASSGLTLFLQSDLRKRTRRLVSTRILLSIGVFTTSMVFQQVDVSVAAVGDIVTVAGSSTVGAGGDGGPAVYASLNEPLGVTVDSQGNIYIADTFNNRVRKVTPDGVISTFLGPDQVSSPCGISAVGPDSVFVADRGSSRILKVNSSGGVSIVAGSGVAGFGGDGGPAKEASLAFPCGIAADAHGNLFIADVNNSRVRKVSSDGVITTVAGNGALGFSGDGGLATYASLRHPFGVAISANGDLYISDSGNHRIRRIGSDGIISTAAGNGVAGFSGDGGPATDASLNYPLGLAIDSTGSLFIADSNNYRVRRLSANGFVSSVAGTGLRGSSGDGGQALSASLTPVGLSVDTAGNLFVVDGSAGRVRRVRFADAQLPQPLTVVVAGNGLGRVSAENVALDCDASCSIQIEAGIPVELVATPAPGSDFVGWTGACSGSGRCVVVLHAAKSVTALFALQPRALRVTKCCFGGGTVLMDPVGRPCDLPCTSEFDFGTVVTLVARPDVGSVFLGWEGDCAGIRNCTLTMSAARWVRANFTSAGAGFNAFGEPQRLVDTRAGQRGLLESGVDEASPFSAGEVRRYLPSMVTGAAPGGSLMVTVVAVAPQVSGFLVAWPCASTAESAPAVSTLNFQAGITISNNGLVRLDQSTGGLCVKSSAAANVVLDAYGWFAASSTYSALPQPQRLVDTRPGQRGVLESARDELTPFGGTTVRRYVPTGVAGLPASGAVAVAVNVAAVSPTGTGEVRLYPCSTTASVASTSPVVVFTPGTTISAGGTVTLSANGGFCVRATAGTHVIVDVTGWYTAAKYRTFAAPRLPKLLLDTRAGARGGLEATDATTPLAANTTYRWTLANKAGFPGAVELSSVRVTLTELSAALPGFVSVWACDTASSPPPATSLLNYRAMVPITGSSIIATAGADAGICLRSSQQTHIALSVTNWFSVF